MAITVLESFTTGPVTLDDRNEVRVREFEIRSTNPVKDRLITENDVIAKVLAGTLNLPRIGDPWEQFEYATTPYGSIAQPGNLDGELGGDGTLRCVGARVVKLGTPGAGTISGFQYQAQFSTRPSAWEVSRHFEVSTRSKTLYADLDAVLPSQGVSQSPPFCTSWTSINQIPPPPDVGNWGHEASVRNGDGIDILEPVFTLTYRKLVFATADELIENVRANILTTNNSPQPPDFNNMDEWLFVGVSGGEIRSKVYDLTFKFIADENRHRQFFYQTDPGSNLPVLDEAGVPICRTYRGYERSNWSPLMGLIFGP